MNRRDLMKTAAAMITVASLGAAAEVAQASPAPAASLLPAAPTLHEMAARCEAAGEIERAALIRTLGSSDLLGAMRFYSVEGGQYTYVKEGHLPGVFFYDGHHAPSTSDGIMNPRTEVLKVAGGDFDLDSALADQAVRDAEARLLVFNPIELVKERRAAFDRSSVKLLSNYLTDVLVNGDSQRDPRQPDGLMKRIIGPQLLSADYKALRLSQLNEAINRVDNPTHLLMCKKMRNLLSTASMRADAEGKVVWTKDEFGTRFATYRYKVGEEVRSLPILVTDFNDRNEPVITFNEVGPIGTPGEGATSIYVLDLSETGLVGLQNGIPEHTDLGRLDGKKFYPLGRFATPREPARLTRAEVLAHEENGADMLRTRLEWLMSPAYLNGRCAARLSAIANAMPVNDVEQA